MRVAAFAALPALAVSAALISPGDAIAQERPEGAAGEETILVAGVGVSPPLEGPFPEEYQGDTITVGVYAHYSAAEGPGGVFSVTHTEADGTLLANLEGQIDCVRVEGQYAAMTGVVTYANTPGVPNGELHEGVVAGIVVEDNGPQDTMIWAFDEIGSSCNDLPAITLVPLKAGNFAVRSW